MQLHDLTRTEVAYLEQIFRLTEKGKQPSVSALASEFEVRVPTAVEVLDKLKRKGLLVKEPWRVPELSEAGFKVAEETIHRHRVIELYFSRKLSLRANEACKEAGKIDYLVSNSLVTRMCGILDHPRKCLHGNAIKHQRCSN
jgi:DtxR family Mn-dependent transcriptional regulator